MIAVSSIPEFTLLGSILANDDMSNRAIAVAKTKFDREAGNDNNVAHDAPELDLVPAPANSQL